MGQTVNLLLRLRRFESYSPHLFFGETIEKKSSNMNAGVAQLVERQPSKL